MIKNINTDEMSFTLHSPTSLEPDCRETEHGSVLHQLQKAEKLMFVNEMNIVCDITSVKSIFTDL